MSLPAAATIVTKQGLGESIESLTAMDVSAFFKTIFITEVCWAVAIWIVKYSILAFYWRLFSTNRKLHRVIIVVLTAFVTCWGISAVCSRPLELASYSIGMRCADV